MFMYVCVLSARSLPSSSQDRVTAWSGVQITTTPATPMSTAGQADATSALAAMAAAGGMSDNNTYPAVMRDALGPVPAQKVGQGQMYPNIPPGGVASHFNAAAAAAGDQVGGQAFRAVVTPASC